MKVSDLTGEMIATFCRVDEDATDRALIETMFLPAAKAYLCSHTGLTQEELDKHEDISIAVCALVSQMYDNRSVEVASDKVNPVVADIIGKYDRNLIPREGST